MSSWRGPAARSKRTTGGTVAAARAIVGDPTALTGAVLVVVLAVLVQKSGGIATTTWYPAALLVVLLTTLALVSQVRAGHLHRRTLFVAGAFAAYLCWGFASITWSGAKDSSWDGSNLGVFYLAILVCAASLPWRRVTISSLLACLSLIVALEGFFAVARSVSAPDLTDYFDYGRLAAPLGYQNAACAAFLMALWPLVLAASRQEVPAVARAVALAGACVLPELALLSQSRASLVAGPVALAIYLVLVPRRARTLLTIAVPLAALVVARGRLLDVFPAVVDGSDAAAHLAAARDALAVSAAFGFVAGLVFAFFDRRVGSPETRRTLSRAVLVLAGTASIGVVVAGAAWIRHPEARLHHAWTTFQSTDVGASPTNGSYFSNGVAGNRYDIWRVALREFDRAPIQGVGVDNFANDYLLQRRSQEEPLYPHSIELRILAQTGIVGAVLFGIFVFAVVRALRRLRSVDETRRASAGMALTVVAYWFVHGSIDWFWELPALGGIAFLCLGAAISLVRPGDEATPAPSRRRSRLGTYAIAGVALIAVLSMLPPWLAAEETARAADGWRHDPSVAYSRLATASRLNPLSSQPDLVGGTIAARLGDWPRMKAFFSDALERQPVDWYGRLELAIAASHTGQWATATREIDTARALDPLEPVIGYVAGKLKARRVVSVETVDQIFIERIRQ